MLLLQISARILARGNHSIRPLILCGPLVALLLFVVFSCSASAAHAFELRFTTLSATVPGGLAVDEFSVGCGGTPATGGDKSAVSPGTTFSRNTWTNVLDSTVRMRQLTLDPPNGCEV